MGLSLVLTMEYPLRTSGCRGRRPPSQRGVSRTQVALPNACDEHVFAYENASLSAKIRALQDHPQKTLSHDHPTQSTQGPSGQRHTVGVDGRPIGSGTIVGRQSVGGADVPASADDIGRVLAALGLGRAEANAADLVSVVERYISRGGQRHIATFQGIEPCPSRHRRLSLPSVHAAKPQASSGSSSNAHTLAR